MASRPTSTPSPSPKTSPQVIIPSPGHGSTGSEGSPNFVSNIFASLLDRQTLTATLYRHELRPHHSHRRVRLKAHSEGPPRGIRPETAVKLPRPLPRQHRRGQQRLRHGRGPVSAGRHRVPVPGEQRAHAGRYRGSLQAALRREFSKQRRWIWRLGHWGCWCCCAVCDWGRCGGDGCCLWTGWIGRCVGQQTLGRGVY